MKLTLKQISVILAIIVSTGSILGLVFKIDTRWAKAAELKKVEFRLEQKIQQDRIEALQQRIWKLEDRYENSDMPNEVKDEIRKLELEKKTLENYIENIIKKTKD